MFLYSLDTQLVGPAKVSPFFFPRETPSPSAPPPNAPSPSHLAAAAAAGHGLRFLPHSHRPHPLPSSHHKTREEGDRASRSSGGHGPWRPLIHLPRSSGELHPSNHLLARLCVRRWLHAHLRANPIFPTSPQAADSILAVVKGLDGDAPPSASDRPGRRSSPAPTLLQMHQLPTLTSGSAWRSASLARDSG